MEHQFKKKICLKDIIESMPLGLIEDVTSECDDCPSPSTDKHRFIMCVIDYMNTKAKFLWIHLLTQQREKEKYIKKYEELKQYTHLLPRRIQKNLD